MYYSQHDGMEDVFKDWACVKLSSALKSSSCPHWSVLKCALSLIRMLIRFIGALLLGPDCDANS